MNTFLFDLDGTLLPMNMDEFTETYMKAFKNFIQKKGYDPDLFEKALWASVKAMYENDGYRTNEECFWKAFEPIMGRCEKKMPPREKNKLEKAINKFYSTDFDVVRFNTRPSSKVRDCIELLKEKGYSIIIATNPLFPEIAVLKRLEWAGVDASDYSYVSTIENSCYTKPNINYYRRLLKDIGKDADECIMVGNDVHEDMCAIKLGMDVFLLDECIINQYDEDTVDFKKGNWDMLYEYIQELPDIN